MDPIEYWGAAPLSPTPQEAGLLCSHAPCMGGAWIPLNIGVRPL